MLQDISHSYHHIVVDIVPILVLQSLLTVAVEGDVDGVQQNSDWLFSPVNLLSVWLGDPKIPGKCSNI